MSNLSVWTIVHAVILSVNGISALIYMIPIIFIRRFHRPNFIFTANLAATVIGCSVTWLVALVFMDLNHTLFLNLSQCALMMYFPATFTSQFPLAIVQISFHRLLTIVYHRENIVRNNVWATIFIILQWLFGFLLGLPAISVKNVVRDVQHSTKISNIPRIFQNCMPQQWQAICAFIYAVVLPSLIYGINSILIFNHVRRSSARIQSITSANLVPPSLSVSRRDLHLARHMVLMFCIFVGGWSPHFIHMITSPTLEFRTTIFDLFLFIAEFSLSFNILNLFLYNHELRKYLRILFT